MKIFYVTNARIPTEKAHGLQISKMCEVFSKLGNKVELIVPDIPNKIEKNVQSYYNLKFPFEITYLQNLFTKWMYSQIGFRLFEYHFTYSVYKYLKNKEVDAVITRSALVVLFLSKQYNVYYEMHDFPERGFWFWKHILKKAKGIIVTNFWKKTEVVEKFGCNDCHVHCAPNGFDPDVFNIKSNQIISRQELGISENDFVLCYAGMLKTMGTEKGVSVILKSLKRLPKHVVALFVGGSDKDIEEYSDMAEEFGVEDRVLFVGRVSHKEIPRYLQIVNVLVAPFPDTPHYRNYMSPIKLFEYLASGKPIISSNLPSVKEIVCDAGILTTPDDEIDFYNAVMNLYNSVERQKEYALKAINRSKKFTWENRAVSIIRFIAKNNNSV